MAKKSDDGTISLHEANRRQMAADRAIREQSGSMARAAHAAVDAAFRDPLQGGRRTGGGERVQKNLRPA